MRKLLVLRQMKRTTRAGSRPARWALSIVLCLTAVLIFSTPNAMAAEELFKLTASDGMPATLFGNSVDVFGDTAVVGAPGPHGNPRIGAAYVFTRAGDTWIEQDKLTPSDGAPGDRFGWSVAISGDTIVVSALWDDVGINPDQGSAYVFTRTGAIWTEQAKLTASDGVRLAQFGFSVGVSGDDVIVGAARSFLEDAGVAAPGSAYVFSRTGGTWTEQVKLTAPDGFVGDAFGCSVALDGDTAVVGTSGGQGSAYVFSRTGGAWTNQAKLTASDGAARDGFGFWVGVSGESVVVGALGSDVTFTDQGSAYVFTRVGKTWTQQAKLTASDGAQGDAFGRSVAVSGDTIVVGAQSDDVGPNNTTDQGSAYVFERTGQTWSEMAHLTARDGTDNDLFGVSVGISGDTAVVGANFAEVGANASQGAAYLWQDAANHRNHRDKSSGSSASSGPSNERPAASKAGAPTRPASPRATNPSPSAGTLDGDGPGAGNADDPIPVVESGAVDEAKPVGAKTAKENDFLPMAALIALLLVTAAAGGFELKKRFGRKTT